MAQFPSMNEKAFQTIAMADGQSLTGSNVFTATTTTGVGCSDGTVQHALPQHHHHQPDHAHRDLQRLGRQGHRLEPRCEGCERRHRGQHLRHLVVGPLPELRHHLCRSRLRDEPVRDLRAEPQRRDVVQVQRHARQHRGQPVRGPGRLIHRITSSPSRFGGARRLIHPHHSSPRPPRVGGLLFPGQMFPSTPATSHLPPRVSAVGASTTRRCPGQAPGPGGARDVS